MAHILSGVWAFRFVETRMKKWVLLLALAVPALGWAQTAALTGFCNLGGSQAAVSGLNSTNYQQGVIPSCTVTVYLTGTTTLATLYRDGNNTPLSNPFTANAVGSVAPGQWIFYTAINQGYDVVMSGGIAPNTYPNPVTLTDLFPGFSFSGSGLTLQHNGTNVPDQTHYNALDNGTIAPDSGYTLAKWLTNSTGGWAAEFPNGAGSGSVTAFGNDYSLVGAFTDSAGNVLKAISISTTSQVTFSAPVGTTELRLGVSDDVMGDNTGSWTVAINGTNYTVLGTATPWTNAGGINSQFPIGTSGSTAATVVPIANVNLPVTIQYVSGTVASQSHSQCGTVHAITVDTSGVSGCVVTFGNLVSPFYLPTYWTVSAPTVSGSVTDGSGTSTANQVALSTGTAHVIQYSTALPDGTTATTQSVGDNSNKAATDAFVIANAGTVYSGTSPIVVSGATISCPTCSVGSAFYGDILSPNKPAGTIAYVAQKGVAIAASGTATLLNVTGASGGYVSRVWFGITNTTADPTKDTITITTTGSPVTSITIPVQNMCMATYLWKAGTAGNVNNSSYFTTATDLGGISGTNIGCDFKLPIPFNTGVSITLTDTTAAASTLWYTVEYHTGVPLSTWTNTRVLHMDSITDQTGIAANAVTTLSNYTGGQPGRFVGLWWMEDSAPGSATPKTAPMEGEIALTLDGAGTPNIQSSGTEDWFGLSNYFQGNGTGGTGGGNSSQIQGGWKSADGQVAVTFMSTPIGNTQGAARFHVNDPIDFTTGEKLTWACGDTTFVSFTGTCTLWSTVYYYTEN